MTPGQVAVESRAGRPDRWSLVPVLIGALALRLWHLGARSVWTDEGSTWTAATAPLQELIRLCAQKDASPPLFYLLSAVAVRLGDTEANLRLVSVLASVGLVWLTYRIARLALDRGTSTIAAAITALSPFQLMYAQEARTYALVACLTTWSTYLFLRALLSERRPPWVPYALVTTLALYTQNIAVLGLGVQGALVIFTAAGRRRLVPWAISVAAAGLLYLPWSVVSLKQMSHLGQSHWYLRPPDERGLFHVFRAVFLTPIAVVTPAPPSHALGLEAWMPRRIAQLLLLLVPAVPLAAAAGALFAPGHRGPFLRAIVVALVLPMAAVLSVSSRIPLWLPRYFVFLTPFLAVLLAVGLARLRPRPLAAAWGILLFLSNGYACFRYDVDYSKERWRDVVRAIEAGRGAGRTAALVTFDVDPFRYYNSRLARPVDVFEVSHADVPFASGYTPEQLDAMQRAATRRAAPYDEVWVVVRSPNSAVRRQLVVRANQAAAIGRVRAGRWRWDATNGPVWATRYVRADSDSSLNAATN